MTPITDAAAQITFTGVSRSPKCITETGRATTGARAAMISATAMLTDWIAMKNTQMLRPNKTPAMAARRKSTRLGQRLVTATITSNTAEAIHIRQNDKHDTGGVGRLAQHSAERPDQRRHEHRQNATPAGQLARHLAARGLGRSSDRVPGCRRN